MVAKLLKKSNQTIVSLEQAKEHLRILHTHEDMYINNLLVVVTDSIEAELDKDLVDTEYTLFIYDAVELNEEIHFPNSPIYNVLDVKFYNGITLIDPINYEFSNTDEYIKFTSLPLDYTKIEIVYKKGFENTDDLPSTIRQASLIMLTDLYQYRGSFVVGKSLVSLDKTLQRLLQPYKQVRFL